MSGNPFLLLFSALASPPSLSYWSSGLVHSHSFPRMSPPPCSHPSLFLTYSIYYSSLLISIGTYRLSPTHSLSKYPGPLVCKISKLWLMYIASTGSLHLYIKRLHDKYGPVVRIGPNELSIVDESLIPSILGVKGMPKGPMWDGRLAGKAQSGSEAAPGIIIGSRNSQGHAKARKSWNTAFTPAAIKGYEPMLIRRVSQLVESLDQRKSKLDLSHWFSYFSFDFMGDIAFGGGFELMRDTNQRFLWHTTSGKNPPSLIHQVPWCIELIRFLPMVGRDMKSLAKFAAEQSTRRLQEGSVHDDIFYYLMESKRLNVEPYPFPLIVSNAVTIIVAGADTTASVLTNMFFYLLSNPKVYRRLQAEVDDTFTRDHGSREPNDAALLTNMPYLNSVM
ncbi:cytochrome P450 [Mycena galericulata]|nr:cytochrome P450 [Mycena galericulata]